MKKKSKLRIKSLPRFITYSTICLLVFIIVIVSGSLAIKQVVSASRAISPATPPANEVPVSDEKPIPNQVTVEKQDLIDVSHHDSNKDLIAARLRTTDTDGLKVIFLTLDDGPSAYTNDVLDVLKAYDVKATFFTNHKQGQVAQDCYRRIIAEGHTLANHTSSHRYEIYNDVDTFMNDVNSLARYHKELTGIDSPKIFRFPGGSLNSNQACIDAILTAGYNYADWNVAAGDGATEVPPPDIIAQNIINGCHDFDVSTVLFHAELKENSRLALPIVIETLKNEGYTFLAMEEDFIYPQHWH